MLPQQLLFVLVISASNTDAEISTHLFSLSILKVWQSSASLTVNITTTIDYIQIQSYACYAACISGNALGDIPVPNSTLLHTQWTFCA